MYDINEASTEFAIFKLFICLVRTSIIITPTRMKTVNYFLEKKKNTQKKRKEKNIQRAMHIAISIYGMRCDAKQQTIKKKKKKCGILQQKFTAKHSKSY